MEKLCDISTPRCPLDNDQSATDGFGAKKAQVNFSNLVAVTSTVAAAASAACCAAAAAALRQRQPQSPSLLFVGICEIISAQIRSLSDVRPLASSSRRLMPVRRALPPQAHEL